MASTLQVRYRYAIILSGDFFGKQSAMAIVRHLFGTKQAYPPILIQPEEIKLVAHVNQIVVCGFITGPAH